MIVFIVSVSPSILPGLSVLGSAPGNPLTLECIVEAYPKPFVVWSFGGVTVMSRHDVVMVLYRRVAARGGARLHPGRAAQLHVQDLLQAHHQQLPTTAGGHLHVCIY